MKWKKKILPQNDDPLKVKIEACRDERSLLQVLMAGNIKKFASSIEKLENGLYGNGKINFKKVKEEVLEKII